MSEETRRTGETRGDMAEGALGKTIVPAVRRNYAMPDEPNAFSFVETPVWMWPWFCALPLLACDLWPLLPSALRDSISPSELIYPGYCRLAMGLSHAVHILMCINTAVVGKTLLAQCSLLDHESEVAALLAKADEQAYELSCFATGCGSGEDTL